MHKSGGAQIVHGTARARRACRVCPATHSFTCPRCCHCGCRSCSRLRPHRAVASRVADARHALLAPEPRRCPPRPRAELVVCRSAPLASLSCSRPSSTIGCYGHRDPLGSEIPLPVIIFDNQRLESTFLDSLKLMLSSFQCVPRVSALVPEPCRRRHAAARREPRARAPVLGYRAPPLRPALLNPSMAAPSSSLAGAPPHGAITATEVLLPPPVPLRSPPTPTKSTYR